MIELIGKEFGDIRTIVCFAAFVLPAVHAAGQGDWGQGASFLSEDGRGELYSKGPGSEGGVVATKLAH